MPPSAQPVADKGYDSQALREWVEERGTAPIIPPRKNRKVQYDYDKVVYKQRDVIERMFCVIARMEPTVIGEDASLCEMFRNEHPVEFARLAEAWADRIGPT